jgi:hypothetical protein
VWKEAAANTGCCERLLAGVEERHSGGTEQDNRRGTDQPDENKLEEHIHPDSRFLSSIGHHRVRINIGQPYRRNAAQDRSPGLSSVSHGVPLA